MSYKRIVDPETGKKRYDLVGERFDRWLVLECTGRSGPNEMGMTTWKCQCDCGKIKDRVTYAALTVGTSRSCGCLRVEQLNAGKKHGRSNTRLYTTWTQMKSRCYDKDRRTWKDYGGRGISVCPRWLDSFENFAEDVDKLGPIPFRAKFDRIDNDKDYEPGNVRWVDDFVSNRNRRSSKWFMWKGEMRTLTEIACMENVDFHSFRNKMAWPTSPVERALDYCRRRGLVYKERAKGRRPEILVQS